MCSQQVLNISLANLNVSRNLSPRSRAEDKATKLKIRRSIVKAKPSGKDASPEQRQVIA